MAETTINVLNALQGQQAQLKRLRERGAARRVLIDSDLRSEPSLDDPCTAFCGIDRAPKPRAADGKLSEVSQ